MGPPLRSEHEIDLDGFLDAFCHIQDDGRLARLAPFYDEPVTLVSAGETIVFDTADAFQDHVDRIWADFSKRGIARIDRDVVCVHTFGPALAVVDVRWRYLTRLGKIAREDNASYVLRRTADGIKVATHIAHNDLEPTDDPG